MSLYRSCFECGRSEAQNCACVSKGGLLAGHLTFGNVTTDVVSLPQELPEIVYRNNVGRKVGIITVIYEIKDFFVVVVSLNRSLGKISH